MAVQIIAGGLLMVRVENHLGTIDISEKYFSSLISHTVMSCFGVMGMSDSVKKKGVFLPSKKNVQKHKGVFVKSELGGLLVDIHIIVGYGINIAAIVSSIKTKVLYVIETATQLKVKRINVFVDAMIS